MVGKVFGFRKPQPNWLKLDLKFYGDIGTATSIFPGHGKKRDNNNDLYCALDTKVLRHKKEKKEEDRTKPEKIADILRC